MRGSFHSLLMKAEYLPSEYDSYYPYHIGLQAHPLYLGIASLYF